MSLRIDYDSANTPPPVVGELLELWRYRDLLKLLVANSIKTRYKRSALGVVWTLLNPLLNTLVLTIAFSQLFKFDVEDYPIFLLAGLLFWNFFSQTVTQAMHTLIWGSSLIKRIYIPRAIFAVSVLGNGLINLLLSLIPLFIIMLFIRHPFRLALLFLPVSIFIIAMFSLGLALFISTIAVFFVDFVEIFNVFLSAWFYLTPIIYPLSIVPKRFLLFIQLNPLSIFIELFRAPIFEGKIPPSASILWAAGLAVATIVIGWWTFTQRANEFAYRI